MKTTNDAARNAAIDTMLSSLSSCGNVVAYDGAGNQYTINVLSYERDFSIVAELEVFWASSHETQNMIHDGFVCDVCDRLFQHLFVESFFAE